MTFIKNSIWILNKCFLNWFLVFNTFSHEVDKIKIQRNVVYKYNQIFVNFMYWKFRFKFFHKTFFKCHMAFFPPCIPLPVSFFFLVGLLSALHSSSFDIIAPSETLVSCQRGSLASQMMSSMMSSETLRRWRHRRLSCFASAFRDPPTSTVHYWRVDILTLTGTLVASSGTSKKHVDMIGDMTKNTGFL